MIRIAAKDVCNMLLLNRFDIFMSVFAKPVTQLGRHLKPHLIFGGLR